MKMADSRTSSKKFTLKLPSGNLEILTQALAHYQAYLDTCAMTAIEEGQTKLATFILSKMTDASILYDTMIGYKTNDETTN